MNQLARVLEPEVMDGPDEAIAYDTMDHSIPNRAFVERLVELDASGHMLDIGTGPGHIPPMVCRTIDDATVVGVDLSPAMIEIAERHRRREGFADRMTYQIADADELPFADGTFDTVFSNTIIHHIADPRPMLREAWRVLKDGGVLLIRDLFRPPDMATVEQLVQAHAGDADAEQQQLFRQSLIAAFTPGELRVMIDELNLSGVEVVVDTDRHVSIQRGRNASR
jgi:ubiquinone/menaquinone biosynthesis C-methylase UbiE